MHWLLNQFINYIHELHKIINIIIKIIDYDNDMIIIINLNTKSFLIKMIIIIIIDIIINIIIHIIYSTIQYT